MVITPALDTTTPEVVVETSTPVEFEDTTPTPTSPQSRSIYNITSFIFRYCIISIEIILKSNDLFYLECGDNMVYMAVCSRWKDLCNGSEWMRENCERTCEVCKPSKKIV